MDLSEGAVNYGNDSLYFIFICENCKCLKEFSQYECPQCSCGRGMVRWNYQCPICNAPMIREGTGVYDVW